jgi:indoleamine 2,3-dioxygenase
MFPGGVIYEGVDPKPREYRGESGANDSIIPTCDNLLQATKKMPANELTDILRDFRTYRPENHNAWLSHVESSANELNIEKFARNSKDSLLQYVLLLDQVRDFRNRHWMFTKEV